MLEPCCFSKDALETAFIVEMKIEIVRLPSNAWRSIAHVAPALHENKRLDEDGKSAYEAWAGQIQWSQV